MVLTLVFEKKILNKALSKDDTFQVDFATEGKVNNNLPFNFFRIDNLSDSRLFLFRNGVVKTDLPDAIIGGGTGVRSRPDQEINFNTLSLVNKGEDVEPGLIVVTIGKFKEVA